MSSKSWKCKKRTSFGIWSVIGCPTLKFPANLVVNKLTDGILSSPLI